MPVRAIDQPASGAPEVMTLGPRPPTRWLRWVLVLTVLALAAPGARWMVYQATKPPPDLTLAQLQGAYYGMVRSDGTNDMSTITPTMVGDPAVTIEPEICAPLFASTVANRFPADAVDGVSTYWLSAGEASISLFTLRYPSTAAAEQAYAAVAGALESCRGVEVGFGRDSTGGVTTPVPVTPAGAGSAQLAYVLDRDGAGRYAFHVLQLSNTISWQYRYEVSAGAYQPLPAQQLMDGLAAQLRYIQDDRARRAGEQATGRR